MTNDRFWKSFWILFVGTTLFCIAGSTSLFFSYVGKIDAAAVGVNYDPGRDPFAGDLRQTASAAVPVITGGYLYKDVVPLGLTAWSWNATITGRSGEQMFEGASSMKAVFTKEWGGYGLGGFKVPSDNQTLTLAVYPDAQVGDLYVSLYDSEGVSLGLQSLGWYTPSGSLTAGKWQLISVPVQNLLGSSTSPTVTAFSINTTNPGTVYIDSIQFINTPSTHAPWIYQVPAGYVAPPFDPFATSTPASLPYTFEPSPEPDQRWYPLRGFFRQDYSEMRIGPKQGVTSDAIVVFRSGKAWTDYQVTAKAAWGTARVFALLIRVKDEQNYVSCSFSNSGDTVQMYEVRNGVSRLVAQSDKLHYSDYNGGITVPGARVHGNTLSCGVDGKQVLQEKIEDIPTQGSVGMEAWDQDDSLTAHRVQSFSVVPLVGE